MPFLLFTLHVFMVCTVYGSASSRFVMQSLVLLHAHDFTALIYVISITTYH